MAWRIKRPAEDEAGSPPKQGKGKEKDRKPKGGGRSSDTNDCTVLEALIAVQKLTLKTASESRDTAHILCDFWLLPVGSSIFKAAVEAGKLYAERVAATGKGNKLGPPHLHVATTTIEAMRDSLQGEDTEVQKAQQRLTEWLTAAGSDHGMYFVAEAISMFKAREAYHADPSTATDHKGKLTIAINHHPEMEGALRRAPGVTQQDLDVGKKYEPQLLQSAINFALMKAGGEKSTGPGPRVALERTVQAQLRKLQQK